MRTGERKVSESESEECPAHMRLPLGISCNGACPQASHAEPRSLQPKKVGQNIRKKRRKWGPGPGSQLPTEFLGKRRSRASVRFRKPTESIGKVEGGKILRSEVEY